jgi:SEC-C motif-containing protein
MEKQAVKGMAKGAEKEIAKAAEKATDKSCPCTSGLLFTKCCAPFISGKKLPATAVALMRSRYAAYTKGEIDYIVDTHHTTTSSSLNRDEIKAWAMNSDWLGLEIVSSEKGLEEDSEGQVEFIAKYQDQKGKVINHHEHSLFEKIDGKWYFKDGKTVGAPTIVREGPKIGRNDACACGSGKKFKKCCLV